MQEEVSLENLLSEVHSTEVWRGYCKFTIDRDFNITDVIEGFRAIEGITVVSSTILSKGEKTELYLIRFKFIKRIHWRDYYKYIKHVALRHHQKSRRIPGLKSIDFIKKPEQII